MRVSVLLLALAAPGFAAEPFRFPEARFGDKAELKYVGNVPLLRVEGTPDEIGQAVGRLALKPGARVLGYPRELLLHRKADSLWTFFKGAGKSLYRNFPAGRSEELEAIARGAAADRELVVCGNTFFDLKKIFACSAVSVGKDRSATGGPLLARNLDYPSLGYIHHYTLVTVYRPRGKLAFASVGFPGLVGVLSGMNEAGLALGVLEVFDSKDGTAFNKKGVPYGLVLRQVLEDARTIDDAQRLLDKLPRTTTINVVIADRDSAAVLEVSPARVVRRDGEKGVCVTTNHFCSAEQKAARPVNIDRTFERFTRLQEARDAGKPLTPDDLREHLDAVNLGTLTHHRPWCSSRGRFAAPPGIRRRARLRAAVPPARAEGAAAAGPALTPPTSLAIRRLSHPRRAGGRPAAGAQWRRRHEPAVLPRRPRPGLLWQCVDRGDALRPGPLRAWSLPPRRRRPRRTPRQAVDRVLQGVLLVRQLDDHRPGELVRRVQ
ncbi:MAG: C45 family peptidase [Gemmataceae bacterium]